MKSEREYLRRKYHADEQMAEMLKDKSYRDIMVNILGVNLEKMSEKVARRSKQKWEETFREPQFKQRKYIVPQFQEVAPTPSEIKARARGQVQGIANTLRMKLTDQLRESVRDFKGRFKEPTYIKRKINGKLETEFQKGISEVFRDYTKRDKGFTYPTNVRTIAVTELRTAISTIKSRIARGIQDRNPGLKLKKKWIHNPHLSKRPEYIRIGHAKINGTRIPIDDYFDVPLYRKVMGFAVLVEKTKMARPHDLNAPASQVIGCHCDVEYSP